MDRRISLGAALCACTIVAPLAVNAQSGTENYYNPPKLRKEAQPGVAVAGAGTVVVQVLVKSNGSFAVQKVLKSTNHGDDAAALDVAQHSTYAPATRGGKPVEAFYDFTLKFTAGGGSSQADEGGAGAGGLATYERELHAGNYSGAQTGLKTYIAAHPEDARAQADLGVASTFLSDYEGAVAAFDKAGTLPDTDKTVAAKAYASYATDALKAKDFDKAVAAAKRGAELAPGLSTQNTLGYVELQAGQNAAAAADLEKARSLAAAPGIKPHDRIAVDDNLIAAYIAAGKPEQVKPVAAEIAQIDPSDTSAQNLVASSMDKAAQAAQDAGKPADAAALFEQAAAAAPSLAVSLYAKAALAYLAVKPPANDKAKADADKALAISGDDATANYAAGIALANTGKTKDAVTFLNKADASAKKGTNAGLTAAIENALKQIDNAK